MKIVHLTDLHIQTAPRLHELFGKRLIGSANLYLLGRKQKFNLTVQQAAIDATLKEDPDIVVITGDLTAQALDAEFQLARDLLDPILDGYPTVLIPGNHDTYVREPVPGQRMRAFFADWMGEGMPYLHQFDEVGFLTVETCRAHPLSSGYTPPTQLAQARALLDAADATFIFLCLHYPLRGRRGEPYGPATRALSNARQVEDELLMKTARINAILHGHEHHGYRVDLHTLGGPRPNLNPGATGYTYLPDLNRTAHLNVYTIEGDALTEVRRLRYSGERFEEEPGGAYATGR
ncbi:MAG: metallophosphoesterase [Myxococcota bacterium]